VTSLQKSFTFSTLNSIPPLSLSLSFFSTLKHIHTIFSSLSIQRSRKYRFNLCSEKCKACSKTNWLTETSQSFFCRRKYVFQKWFVFSFFSPRLKVQSPHFNLCSHPFGVPSIKIRGKVLSELFVIISFSICLFVSSCSLSFATIFFESFANKRKKLGLSISIMAAVKMQ
jgi:hypothetical protein